jgi:hypothetical protein
VTRRFTHAYDIAFEVKTDKEWRAVTAQDLRDALTRRLNNMSDREIIEACGAPFDTSDEEEEAS